MSEFQFQKSQRVIVPADIAGAEGVQGVITGNAAFLGREPEYQVQWPSADTVGEDLKPVIRSEIIVESVLLAAQPPMMIAMSAAEKLVLDARTAAMLDVRRDLDPEINRMQATIVRLEKSAGRRLTRKAKRNSRKRG